VVAADAVNLLKRNSRKGAKAQRKNRRNRQERETHKEPLKRLRKRSAYSSVFVPFVVNSYRLRLSGFA
jgi:hypothetical protein